MAKSCRICGAVAGENSETLCPECFVLFKNIENREEARIVS